MIDLFKPPMTQEVRPKIIDASERTFNIYFYAATTAGELNSSDSVDSSDNRYSSMCETNPIAHSATKRQ